RHRGGGRRARGDAPHGRARGPPRPPHRLGASGGGGPRRDPPRHRRLGRDALRRHQRPERGGALPSPLGQGDLRQRAPGALARRRKAAGRPGKLTCATKHNMLPATDGLFREVATRLAASYPDVRFETFIVDDFARRLVAEPQALDVVVLPNLYGDILSDAAAGVIGGLGLAPSGCYGNGYAYFEPAHGSAPDIAGKGIINP